MTTNLWNLFLINQKEMKNQHCVLSQLMFWFWTTMVFSPKPPLQLNDVVVFLVVRWDTWEFISTQFFSFFGCIFNWRHDALVELREGKYLQSIKTLPWIYGSWQILMALEIGGNWCHGQCIAICTYGFITMLKLVMLNCSAKWWFWWQIVVSITIPCNSCDDSWWR